MSRREAIVLIDVEHRARDAALAQGFDQRVLLHHGAAADIDQPGAGFHPSEALAVEEVMRLLRERAGDHHEVAGSDERIELRWLRFRRQAIEPPLVAQHAHAEAAMRDGRDPPADGPDAAEA